MPSQQGSQFTQVPIATENNFGVYNGFQGNNAENGKMMPQNNINGMEQNNMICGPNGNVNSIK
jgi:hypothetical protein